MPVIKVITSPHRFPERFTFFGDGGAGKSNAVCNMARYMPDRKFYVVETDISPAYDRLLALEYPDVEANGNMTIQQAGDWDEFTAIMDEYDAYRSPTDWLVVDNGTFTWPWCQEQHIEATYGMDIDTMQAKLKAQFKDDAKGYFAALADMMQWPIINKKYTKGYYRHFMKWPGPAVQVQLAKTTKGEKDGDILAEFQHHGAMPQGQKDGPAAMHTNILFQSMPGKKWRISTTKDRGRPKLEKEVIDEFAMDYLVTVAGWTVERKRVD